ncbi:MAG TPA: DUF502 domain-containing protein [Candidatus Rifleibacterium sp.]|nr:DUF502 domain-containing protein [Candidatus Rifleibacterium sp.]HNW10267.1 DUF502 domain-containing protein [Candidatus Rifleibacterium sp.]HOI91491.1 DUF502 domain-containing protein [Candidatus Rifleibacterium sp.]
MKLPIEHERLNRTLEDAGQRLNNLLGQMRKYLITGVLVLVPFVVTIYIMYAFFQITDGLLGVAVSRAIGYRVPGMGLILTALICVSVGMIAQNYFGKRLIASVDNSLEQIPGVRSLYNGIKQVADVIVRNTRSEFKRVVMLEYPKEDSWVLGFVTGDFVLQAGSDRLDDDMISVFVPTTPNPTSGFLLIISKKKIIDTHMDIEDAMKIVISGGLVQPGRLPEQTTGETAEDFVIPH